jgi:hypothetical protein
MGDLEACHVKNQINVTTRVEINLLTLKAVGTLSLLTNHIQDGIHKLSTLRVV